MPPQAFSVTTHCPAFENCSVSLRDMDTPRKKYEEADQALKTEF